MCLGAWKKATWFSLQPGGRQWVSGVLGSTFLSNNTTQKWMHSGMTELYFLFLLLKNGQILGRNGKQKSLAFWVLEMSTFSWNGKFWISVPPVNAVYAKGFWIPKIKTSPKTEGIAIMALIQSKSFVLWRSCKDFSLYFLFCLYSKIISKRISDRLELLGDRKNVNFLHLWHFPQCY